MTAADRREELEAALMRATTQQGRASQIRRVNGIEDYLFIGGDQTSARRAAERLGRSTRTVQRYRAALRAIGLTGTTRGTT